MKYIELNDQNKTVAVQSGKPQSIELALYLFKLRPDVKALSIDSALDVQALIKLFSEI